MINLVDFFKCAREQADFIVASVKKIVTAITLACCFCVPAIGQSGGLSENPVQKLEGTAFTVGNYVALTFADQSANSKKIINIVKLELIEETSFLMPDLPDLTIEVEIQYGPNASTVQTMTRYLTVGYKKGGGTRYDAKNYLRFEDAEYMKVTLKTPAPTISGFNFQQVLRLSAEMNITRWYQLQSNAAIPAITESTLQPNSDELTVKWYLLDSYGKNAYQLEWAWVETEMLPEYGTPGTQAFYDAIFNANSTRVDLPNAALGYNIPVYYDGAGKLYYRVRGINVSDAGVDVGPWSDVGIKDYATGHNDRMNWQVRTSFAEEGKRKTVMEYFDGGLRSRQTVTKDNQTGNTIAAETFYDGEGRPAVQVLPAPLLGTSGIVSVIQYQESLNLFNGPASTQASTQDPAAFFDLVPSDPVAYPMYAGSATAPLSTGSGASKYYSNANNPATGKDALIPDAAGRPYTVTRYTPDGTGRVMAQSGVGEAHRMGSGHETKYFYGTPAQEELDGLFGTEVGNYTHYFKNMVLDANGQASVSYVDMHGRTVATALAGGSPTSLLPINSPALYPNQGNAAVVRNLLDENTNRVKESRMLESVTSLLVPAPGLYTFNYSLTPQSLGLKDCSTANICFGCTYDLEIAIVDESGDAAPVINRYTNLIPNPDTSNSCPATIGGFGFINPATGEAVSPLSNSISFTKELGIGSYSVRKTLAVNEKSLQYFKEQYLRKALCKTFKELVDSVKNTINCDPPEAPTCSTCVAGIANYKTDYYTSLNYTAENAPDNIKKEVETAYKDALANCNLMCGQANVVIATKRELMLADMIPFSGQYATRPPTTMPAPGTLYSKYNIFSTNGPGLRPSYKNPKLSSGDPGFYLNRFGVIDPLIHGDPLKLGNTDHESFNDLFSNSWAEALLPYHPEYDRLKFAENQMANSYAWINTFNQVATYDDAAGAGYVYTGATPANGVPSGDPFYTLAPAKKAAMEPWVTTNYLNQGAVVNGETPGVNIGMWQMAYGIVMCRETAEGSARRNCMNTAPPPPYSGLTALQRDAIWEQFKKLYIAERDQQVNAFIAESYPIPDDNALIAGGYKLHFPKSNAQFASQIKDVEGSGAMSWYPAENSEKGSKPVDIDIAQLAKEYREGGCEAYIASWRKSLLQCSVLAGKTETVREQILTEITTRMLAICKLGVNAANPMGSSTVPPSTPSTVTERTFEDVVNAVFLLNDIPKDYYCNPYVIEAPKPYGLSRPIARESIAILDTCACSRLTAIKAEAAAFLQAPITSVEQLNGYLSNKYNETITTELYTTMESKCSSLRGLVCEGEGKFAVCRDTAYTYPLATPQPLPEFLKCGFEGRKRCYTCDEMRVLTADFKAAFPSAPFHNGPVFSANNTLSADAILQNQLFARYVNFKTGMQYSWADYAKAMATHECSLDTATYNGTGIVICRNDQPLNDTTGHFVKESPCKKAYAQAVNIATLIYEARVKELTSSFEAAYRAKCLAAGSAEQFTVNYTSSEYHYTLYYYDQAGSLVQTVPPAGVRPNFSDVFLAQVASNRAANTRYAPNHKLLTRYLYNSLNQVVVQKTPDGGESHFWYDYLGRLVVSQNAKQKGTHDFGEAGGSYSYTVYDPLGRITEVGQKDNAADAISQALTQHKDNLAIWLAGGSNVQITKTIYDEAYAAWYQGPPPAGFTARNLRNRVAYTLVQETTNDPGAGYRAGTFYSYDIHGNVDVLMQDYANGIMQANGSGNRWKLLAYKYDLISGKVNEVAYQEGLSDAFYHRYDYDAENRLTKVETSRDRILWEKDAVYSYYRHGPLARTELGCLKVQGIDYAYTLQGWLKSINPSITPHTGGDCPPGASSPNLILNDRMDPAQYPKGSSPPLYTASNSISFIESFKSLDDEHFETLLDVSAGDCNTDPTAVDLYDEDGDPASTRKVFARDAYKLNLHYYDGDYTPIAMTGFKSGSQLTTGRNDLYNGNISSMAVNIRKLATMANSPGANYAGALLYNYQYDQLNRIASMDAFATDGSFLPLAPQTPMDDYKERYSYDPNGNILGLERNGTKGTYSGHASPNVHEMDDLVYQYERDPLTGELTSNRLRYVYDNPTSSNYTEDIDNQTAFTSSPQVETDNQGSQQTDNYQYDEIGNLIHDEAEKIETIVWTVYGKIAGITKKDLTQINYTYDASGNRISKTVIPPSGEGGATVTTWYVRDAQGNVMSTYVEGDASQNSGALTQTEVHLYGSSRLGILNCSVNCSGNGLTAPSTRTLTRGQKFFELSNHLGNVLATVTDRLIQMPDGPGTGVDHYLADVASATDYYPFGMPMPGRSFSSSSYRYGFNGKENDNEVKGLGRQQDFDNRIYDPALGRFTSIDSRFRNYPSLSPYSFSGNNPIMFVDDNGRTWGLPKSWWQGKGYGAGLLAGMADGLIETVEGGVELGKLSVEMSPAYMITHPRETYQKAKKAAEIATAVYKVTTDVGMQVQVFIAVNDAIGQYVGDFSGANGDTEAGYTQGKLAFNILLMFVGAEEIKGLMQTGKFSAEALAEINVAKNSGKFDAALEIIGCFVEGTLVLTKYGYRPIQTITDGDSVTAHDVSRHITKQFAVHNPTIKVVSKLVRLLIGNTLITTTEEHPFYTNRGWISAVDLESSDSLFTHDSKIALSTKVLIDTTPVRVYNFTVEEAHTYYVSTLGVLVHNTCFFKEAEVKVMENGIEVMKKASVLEKLGFVGQAKYNAAKKAIQGMQGGENFVMRSEEEATKLLEEAGAKITRNETGANAPVLDPSKVDKNTNGHFGEHINFEYDGKKGTIAIEKKG